MGATVLKCLVTITRAEVADSRVLDCINDDGCLLVIPMDDYGVAQAQGRKEMMLRIPDQWLVTIEGGDHDLVCRKTIDLDKFDELPWAQ